MLDEQEGEEGELSEGEMSEEEMSEEEMLREACEVLGKQCRRVEEEAELWHGRYQVAKVERKVLGDEVEGLEGEMMDLM